MSIPDELRNIRDHLRAGRFGQREVWERQLETAADEIERLRALSFEWMTKHDRLLGFIQKRPDLLKELITDDKQYEGDRRSNGRDNE